MSERFSTFERAFLDFLRHVRESDIEVKTSVISTPLDDSSDWWASWNIDLGGRTYVLNLISLQRVNKWTRERSPKAPTKKIN